MYVKISGWSIVESCVRLSTLGSFYALRSKHAMKEVYWRHSHGYSIAPKITQQWLDYNFWEFMKRIADCTRKMKHVYEIQAKYPKHDFSLGHNHLNWVPLFRTRSFSTKKLSCVRNFEKGFSEYVISRWRHRIYGKAEERILQRKYQTRSYINIKF